MKAIVVSKAGENPKLVNDFPLPEKQNENEVLLQVKSVAVKNLDKLRASGKHYSLNYDDGKAKIVGMDGVGTLEDGTRVYAVSKNGILAEQAWVQKESIVPIPNNLDSALAAALPNAVMGAALALRFRAKMKQNNVVLVNGATGVTGKIAVQLAKLYGAKHIIATGRNEHVLEELYTLGANKTINLKADNDSIVQQVRAINKETPIDVVIDYLWGKPAEFILSALKSKGNYTHQTRFVTVGAMAGDNINLSSAILRSTDIQILGSGLGTWTSEETKILNTEILPEAFDLAAKGALQLNIESIGIEDVETYWHKKLDNAKRLVVNL